MNLQYVTLFSRWAIDVVVLYCNIVLLGVLLCTMLALEMLNDRASCPLFCRMITIALVLLDLLISAYMLDQLDFEMQRD